MMCDSASTNCPHKGEEISIVGVPVLPKVLEERRAMHHGHNRINISEKIVDDVANQLVGEHHVSGRVLLKNGYSLWCVVYR